MNNLQNTIKGQIKEAMMAKDVIRLTVLRGLVSAFTNELVAKGRTPQSELSDEEVLIVIKRQVKQRKDAIEQFTNGGRPELAESEAEELKYLEVYLPTLMNEEEVKKIVLNIKESFGVVEKKDIGKFMAEVMKELKGKADGVVVKNVVDSLIK